MSSPQFPSYDPGLVKAIFIDLDGTLVDSLPQLYEVYTQFLRSYNESGSYEEFCSLNGPSLKEIVAVLQERLNLNGTTDSLTREYSHKLEEFYRTKITLFPGVLEFLGWAKSKNLQTALVTSAGKSIVDIVLKKNDLQELFDYVGTSEMVLQSKPHPAIYLKTMQMMQLQPLQVLAIEDSKNGIAAAQAAKITTFAFNSEGGPLINKEGILAGNWFTLLQELRSKIK
jgi:HAD superfamily hydrolase (TIGR01509 family)